MDMSYVCFTCRKEVQLANINAGVSCPNCSGKILFKKTPEVTKTVLAR